MKQRQLQRNWGTVASEMQTLIDKWHPSPSWQYGLAITV